MGYYVTLTDANFGIPETPEVLAALHEMETKFHEIKQGGSSNGDKWFSWMPDVRTLTSVEEVFERLGFSTRRHQGLIWLDAYDSKTGQEDLFLAVVAPFVEDDSYTVWRGEGGEMWKNVVRGGRMYVERSEIVWADPEPYMESVYGSVGSFADKTYKMYVVQVDPYASAAEIEATVEQARANAPLVGA